MMRSVLQTTKNMHKFESGHIVTEPTNLKANAFGYQYATNTPIPSLTSPKPHNSKLPERQEITHQHFDATAGNRAVDCRFQVRRVPQFDLLPSIDNLLEDLELPIDSHNDEPNKILTRCFSDPHRACEPCFQPMHNSATQTSERNNHRTSCQDDNMKQAPSQVAFPADLANYYDGCVFAQGSQSLLCPSHMPSFQHLDHVSTHSRVLESPPASPVFVELLHLVRNLHRDIEELEANVNRIDSSIVTNHNIDNTVNTSSNSSSPEPGITDRSSFACDETGCIKTFATQGSLKRHKFLAHTNARPHTCELCKMGFKLHHHLKRHILSQHNSKKRRNLLTVTKGMHM